MIGPLLIANRGEIAVRIMRTAKRLGLRTVAVYSDADADAEHVRLADSAVRIGGPLPRESYLNIEALLTAARASGARAVHPGYGFLAESPAFAAACEGAGLVFVGPRANAIEAMGNKALAKQRMRTAGVPCIPGYDGEDTSDARLLAEGSAIGFPLMVKAAAGGGGRGMRLVTAADALAAALYSARSEAQGAFGDGRLILERALVAPRHVEVQVMADAHGNVLHLGERDCSIQRRHQKIVEEAPSPAVNAALRERMGQSAIAVASQIGYCGAGTVEFLLDADGAYYFMEMNTRLQVEHAVTEAVTGLDLVELQLRVAAGERLGLTQSDVCFKGHAIEVRLCAESPAQDFLPQTGTMALWEAPGNVRVDHALRSGAEVSPWYDSMLGKLVAHGATREDAAQRLADGLDRTVALGVNTNRAFLAKVIRHPVFLGGDFSTRFIGELFPTGADRADPVKDDLWAIAAVIAAGLPAGAGAVRNFSDECFAWSSTGQRQRPVRLMLDGEARRYTVATSQEGMSVTRAGADTAASLVWQRVPATGDTCLRVGVNGVVHDVHYTRIGKNIALQTDGREAVFTDLSLSGAQSSATGAAGGALKAPINGRVIQAPRATGGKVAKGDAVIVLEAMKMEHILFAPHDGTVAEMCVATGDQVAPGQLLARIEALA